MHPGGIRAIVPRFAPSYGDAVGTVGSRFQIPGEQIDWAPLGSGHIHETWVSTWGHDGGRSRYVHQRLNTHVFPDPEALMRNVCRVTDHLWRVGSQAGLADLERRCLRLVPARDERAFFVDERGHTWRTYHHIEAAHTCDRVQNAAQAREAARAFGTFVRMLSSLAPPPLEITIPDFHDLGRRFTRFLQAVRSDPLACAASVTTEIEATVAWTERLETALSAEGLDALPRRVVHNDCKLDNVLLDDASGEGLCVIDLDTVMDGTVLWDFGDLVRTAAFRAAEDTVLLETIRFDPDLFEALARGYLEGAGGLLGEAELGILPLAGPTLALENAIRFLTDHLEGDVYFRIHRSGHNLDRNRSQLRRIEVMMSALGAARRCVQATTGSVPRK